VPEDAGVGGVVPEEAGVGEAVPEDAGVEEALPEDAGVREVPGAVESDPVAAEDTQTRTDPPPQGGETP
jgi:hypothetical protein